MPTAVTDQAGFLQMPRRLGHAFAPHAQHIGDQFLRHDDFVGPQAVQAKQQPAAQLLVQRVVPIAHGGLGHLRQERLRVAQQQVLHGPAPVELVFQGLAFQLIGRTRALNDGAAGCGFSAHEERNADDAFIADHRDLCRCAVFHDA
ncbi:hypothetical protein D3C73_983750 [compost metagenome]